MTELLLTADRQWEAQDVQPPSLSTGHSPARVRIFNVKYSPNLGDGLLSECLERALIDCGASPDTWSVDLAGRTSYAAGTQARSMQLRVLGAIPAPLRRLAVRAPLAIQSRRKWQPHYGKALDEADCMVIGGGNLITDLDLNFPTKIALAVEEAARRNLPAFLYACGVSGNWSPKGQALLRSALDRKVIRRVFLRDERSRQLWNRLAGIAHGLEATVVRDPGLLASVRYDLPAQLRNADRPTIGVNVTSHLALRYHADDPPSAKALNDWYLDLSRALIAKGCRIAVFTNGTPEDRAYAARLRPAFAAMGDCGTVSFPEACTPGELTRVIAGLDGLAAFRMHAVIAAYSCGVPFLALAWDPKLDSFVRSLDRDAWLCQPVQTAGAVAADQLIAATQQGIPEAERKLAIAQARRDVAMLHAEIANAVA